ncbi:DUF5953 family protein [Archangium lansingense]|uniref:DUF5953 family protein n=1 Tax=Archangium lansingense TaxID=2995310 RepID=A0ABT3ZWR2_9BACT|nr:DUF5953 family protein [Archangium lansinium]MCY1073828.1 DUF5953 family protein [Archangium lansinium]
MRRRPARPGAPHSLGWLARPTHPTLLELDDPVHLAALQNAYERFSEIAGRTSP